MSDPQAAIVVLAGGSGSRVGADRNKVLLPLAGTPVIAHSVRTALDVEGATRLVVVVRPEDREDVAAALAPVLGPHDLWLVDGGAERHDSEWAAIQLLAPEIEAGDIEVVAIHDAARPLATAALFRTVIDVAHRHGAAVPAVAAGTLSDERGANPRTGLAAVQTPQAFSARVLLDSYRQAAAEAWTGTDTAACLERYSGLDAYAVAGSRTNLKVTFPEDLALAQELVRQLPG